MSSTPLFFFEQTDFSLRLARCANRERPLHIEELKEFSAEEAAAFIATLPANAAIICAARPKNRALHLANADEAKRHAGLAGVRKFLELSAAASGAPKWYAAVQARDGAAPAGTPWLSSSSGDAHPLAVGSLEALQSKSVRSVSATIAAAGALASTVNQSVLLIEVGELASHALLVSRDGVLAAGAISLDLARIGEAVQTELSLKFRGSAVKLFFNPDYDFSDAGPKIAVRLAASIKADLAKLLANRPAPTALFVAGLPATQQWFGPQLASALSLTTHVPDLKTWSGSAGITFATPEVAAHQSPAWFNLLHSLHASSLAKPATIAAWQSEWISFDAPVAASTPVAAPAPVAAVTPPAAPAAKPAAPTPAPKAAVAAVEAKPTPKPAPAPAPTKAPAAPAKAAPAPVSSSNKPAATVGAQKPVPTPAAKPVEPKKPEKPAEPVVAKAPVAPAPRPTPALDALKPAKKKNPTALMAVAGVVIALVAGGGLYVHSQSEAAARLALEKQQTEQRLKAEMEKAQLAEQKAKEEAESRKKIEAEFSQKLVTSETARQQAESEALAQTAARLANARGSLVVTTNPAGAMVTVGNLPPRNSPATFSDIKIGTYPVTITLAHHEEMKLELAVKENATTESGPLALVALFGALKIISDPGVAAYELHPANTLMVAPESRRTGRTPASLEDLSPGDYSVTLTREGWAPHTQVVSITRSATTYLKWQWPNGVVKITSTPAGATVMRAGTSLGVTPLTLTDQAPGETRYEETLDHFEPLPLVAHVEGGGTLELSAQFKPEDRVFAINEVDQKPDAIGSKQPELPYYLTLEGGRVEIQLTVNRDGTTKNLSIVQASSPDLGKYCLAAVTKWQFKPGQKSGSPVNVKLKLPFVFKAAKS